MQDRAGVLEFRMARCFGGSVTHGLVRPAVGAHQPLAGGDAVAVGEVVEPFELRHEPAKRLALFHVGRDAQGHLQLAALAARLLVRTIQ